MNSNTECGTVGNVYETLKWIRRALNVARGAVPPVRVNSYENIIIYDFK